MKRLAADLLSPTDALDGAVLHGSGLRLFNRGEAFSTDHLRMLREAGIAEVFLAEPGDDLEAFEQHARYEQRPVPDLRLGDRIAQPVFNADGTLLFKGGPVESLELCHFLRDRGVRSVGIERRGAQLLRAEQFLAAKHAFARQLRHRQSLRRKLAQVRMLMDCGALRLEEVAAEGARGGHQDAPRGSPLEATVEPVDPAERREASHTSAFQGLAESARERTRAVLAALRSGEAVDGDHVGETLETLVGGLVRDRDLLLSLQHLPRRDDYLVEHAVRTALLAINVATRLGYSEPQILELGYAAILADLGMQAVPDAIRAKPGPLTPDEQAEVRRHPEHGLRFMRALRNLPASVPLVTFQVHERMDGSGYPRGTPGDRLHRFARVLMVCDTYDALIADRPHRAAVMPYQAVELVLRLAHQQRFDAEIVRGLLRTVSLFPVGSFLRLSDGRIAQVIATNGDQYTRPTVRVLLDAQRRPLAAPATVNLAATPGLAVDAPLAPADVPLPTLAGF